MKKEVENTMETAIIPGSGRMVSGSASRVRGLWFGQFRGLGFEALALTPKPQGLGRESA